MPESALPDHLKGKLHADYPKWLQWVPRSWTSFTLVQPPRLLLGNQRNFSFAGGSFGPAPIPEPTNTQRVAWSLQGVQITRSWPVLPLYFVISIRYKTKLIHFRVGCRWDDVDGYYDFPSIAFFIREQQP